jgi:pSer/pThr/pTyr-binding forkhead associated (FHA) protein
VTVGRLPTCDLPLTDPRISREHCRIWLDPGSGDFLVCDLGSANGTKLNARLVQGAGALRHGDQISIGGTTLSFTLSDVPPHTSLGARWRTDSKGEEFLSTRT